MKKYLKDLLKLSQKKNMLFLQEWHLIKNFKLLKIYKKLKKEY